MWLAKPVIPANMLVRDRSWDKLPSTARSMVRHLQTILILIAAIAFVDAAPSSADEPVIDFGRDVRPILRDHCLECHGGVKQAADLSFIHRDAALDVIEPGEPDESIIIDRITSDDESEVMPPPEHQHPLSGQQIETLRAWIAQGAKWQQPWAYEKPSAPRIPNVGDPDWCRNSVDRFILARLDRESIRPSSEAAPHQWLRRVSLDLVGLPPAPAELEAFLDDVRRNGETAYRRTVDRLLASPRFGERWATVWLDQVRYADSRGLGLDGRRQIWKYRDWVISALNDDMSFDQFTIKQLAGDLLPDPTIGDLVATAASRLTQTNEEGGTDDEEFRISAVLDRVNTVWQTWQGITFGCVQCHNHPYDPIQHDEFYKFAAFFNNSVDCDLSEDLPLLAVPLDPADEARASELDQQIKALGESIWMREAQLADDSFADWRDIDSLSAEADKETRVDVEIRDGKTEFYTVDTLSSNTTITLTAGLPEGTKTLAAIRLTIAPRNPETAQADSEWGFVISHFQAVVSAPDREPQELKFVRVLADEPHPLKNPDASLNEKSGEGFAAYSRIHYPRQAVIVLEQPVEVSPESELTITLKNRVTLLGAFPLVARRGSVAISEQPGFVRRLADAELQADRERLERLRGQRRKIPSVATPIMRQRPAPLTRPTHVFIRGLFLTKGEQVQPAVPASFPSIAENVPADRQALASWLVSLDNPLTARVTVNRVWARLFGIGLVATEEDFGSSGEPPFHPELLDHLAVRFQHQQGWSIKRLLRSLVLASSYRQDAKVRPELLERDPQNRLLTHGPRFRMLAEMIRDSGLAVSGLLSARMHGAPVHPPIPDGIWKPFSGGDKWQTAPPGDPNRYRRSIYTYTKRSIPYPMFAAFDAPSREFCAPRRLRSNTPLQALMTLNDPTFVECSEALAKIMFDKGAQAEVQIGYGFLAVTTRHPSSRELETLVQLYEQCRVEDASKSEAMIAVASVLLNLDEITSK
jgi:hypothetical protein